MMIQRKLSNIEKKKILGVLLIMSLVAFGAILIANYIVQSNIDVTKAVIVALFIGGVVSTFMEMRGTLGKRLKKPRNKRTIRKTKTRRSKR
jgi:uncharacterized membrane protein